MNSRHVYIENYYSFSTPHLNIRHLLWEVFDVFHEIFSKYREGNQYRVTATSALTFVLIRQKYSYKFKRKKFLIVIFNLSTPSFYVFFFFSLIFKFFSKLFCFIKGILVIEKNIDSFFL
jgi:hypothetical protein